MHTPRASARPVPLCTSRTSAPATPVPMYTPRSAPPTPGTWDTGPSLELEPSAKRARSQPLSQRPNAPSKVINDPIHGHLELSGLALSIIDTPEFQRLRRLKQLGTTYLIFPGAEHTRFQHSIGVYHLARKQMEILSEKQPELLVTAREVELVAIAGLCHDLGHGPYSHAFEEWVNRRLQANATQTPTVHPISTNQTASTNSQETCTPLWSTSTSTSASVSPTINPPHSPSTSTLNPVTATSSASTCLARTITLARPLPPIPATEAQPVPSKDTNGTSGIRRFEHESMSLAILRLIIRKYHVDISNEEFSLISCCITDDESTPLYQTVLQRLPPQKRFLLNIVSNAENSIDVDKFDYLMRDSHHSGKQCGFDPHRLMSCCRVVDGILCYQKKEVYDVYELFRTRYSMFKQVYGHQVSKAVEYMLMDAFTLADPYLHISASVSDPAKYVLMTDDVLALVRMSSDKRLDPARALLHRVERRQLYRCVHEAHYSEQPPPSRATVLENVVRRIKAQGGGIEEKDLKVQILKLNYAHGRKNPVDSVKFFSSAEPNKMFSIPRSTVSAMLPSVFVEYYVRLYCTAPHAYAPSFQHQPKVLCSTGRVIAAAAKAYFGSLSD